MSGLSRRPPYPYQLRIGEHGVMLVDGTYIGKKTQTLENVSPTAQEYDSAPVYKERTFAFQPQRGMGEHIQASHTSKRYRYMLNAQVVNGLFGKGPLTHTLSPTTTGSIRDFIDALNSGAVTQFILAGQNVLVRGGDTSGTQTVSETRVGNTAMSAVRFKGNYASAVDGLYVAWSDGALRQYNGSTWAAATLPAGFAPQLVETIGDEFWACDPGTCIARKATGDPLLSASWSGGNLIGNPTSRVTAMKNVDNRLVFLKDDGSVFTLNADGSDNDMFPGLRTTPSAANAVTAQAWIDQLYFRMGTTFYRLSMKGGPTLEPIGPERLRDNDSEVQGAVQAFAGYSTLVGFAAVYNSSNSASYLMSYGSWQVPNEGSSSATAQFVDQWDGALVKWTGKQVSAMRVSGIGAPDTRLYVGFTDGTYDYIKLVPNPLANGSGAEFTAQASKVYIPLHHAMFQADWKTFNGFSVFGPLLSASDYAQIAYRLDGSTASYTGLGGSFTTPGQRLDTPNPTVGHVLDTEVTLVNTTSSDTPIIDTVAIHETVRPALKKDISASIDARNGVALLDGRASRVDADDVRAVVYQAAGAPGSVTLTLPDEVIEGLSFFGYQETLLPRNRTRGRGWQIDIAATEYSTHTVTGTIGRFRGTTFGDLAGVLIGQLRSW